jgi:hypothetical protein
MSFFPSNPLYSLRIWLKWRRARKRGKTLRLAIGKPLEFFKTLNNENLRYVVLRWFDDVPRTEAQEKSMQHDVDLLVDSFQIERICRVAARFPGKIKFDFYSQTGRLGTAFKKYPYYPPVLAEEILENRELHDGLFFVPALDAHLKSLAFHLVYHKGIASGIPTGVDLATEPAPSRDYLRRIESLSEKLPNPLPRPITLLSLHEFLKSANWSMPHDLMVRWPQQHEWMRWLIRHEEEIVADAAKQFPQLTVFLLRSDSVEPALVEKATELLKSKFKVLKTEKLSDEQVRRVVRSVRGGNWIEHKKTTLVEPRLALICEDPNPKLMAEDHPLRRKYPLVQNENVFLKNEVRARLNASFPIEPKRIAIHGSDNAIEAQHFLRAIYGANYERALAEIKSLR